ncbi:hypothetical protein DFH27DRAFT_563338, partial [Peziza echinospora]
AFSMLNLLLHTTQFILSIFCFPLLPSHLPCSLVLPSHLSLSLSLLSAEFGYVVSKGRGGCVLEYVWWWGSRLIWQMAGGRDVVDIGCGSLLDS